MTITIISHIYNEEYLLPYWLEYHKKIFSHGIIIDYNSTDHSISIVKKICPSWKIIQSLNKEFGAEDIDREVMNIENEIEGYKIVLNTTEFLISTKNLEDILLKDIYAIKPLSIARTDINHVNNTKEFLENLTHFNVNWRGGRRYIHKHKNGQYNIGRHQTYHLDVIETNEIFIAWAGFYPWNENMMKRKLQIQTKIPLKDKIIKAGFQHITDENISNCESIELMKNSISCKNIHPKFLNYTLSLFSRILIIGGNGYIGSSLYEYLNKKFEVDILDITWNEKNKYTMDYKNITSDILDKYDTIILLAGNTSVKSSMDLKSTFINNISNFINLLDLLKEQKLIYASSASIYNLSNNMSTEDTLISINSHNYYDLSKKVIDMYTSLSNKHIYGLRFGTLSGSSKNFRTDIVINSMVSTSLNEKNIFLYTKDSKRAILGLNDLNKAVEKIIKYNDKSKKGIYNLCSFNTTIESIAIEVSSKLKSKIIYAENTDNIIVEKELNKTNYDFELDNTKFKEAFNFKFTDTLDSLITNITKTYDQIQPSKRNIDTYKEYIWTYKEKKECRVCTSKNIISILNLGNQPLANNFHKNEKILEEYPLKLMLCDHCYHLQLSHIVNPNIMFKNYIYLSSTSTTLSKYFEWFTEYTLNKIKLYNNTNSSIKVLEIACNDGSQLDQYSKYNFVKTIGVDPAQNIYNISSKKKHKIYCDYWCDNVCNLILEEYKYVDIIIAQNVFAHTDDIHSFLENCKKIMLDDTILFIQTSQANMLLNNEYDTIYHEHLSFFSVKSMLTLVKTHDLHLNNVDKVDIHGTSFIFEISKIKTKQNIDMVIKDESSLGLYNKEFYINYSKSCIHKTERLKKNLQNHKDSGYTIISYGASAKGNTILNFIKGDYVEYIVDDSPIKWNTYTPGSNIIVKNPIALKEETNKIAILMLTWNFANEIVSKVNNLNLNVEVSYIQYHNI
jgi:nucleoside-diphosphate-sugar epimerase